MHRTSVHTALLAAALIAAALPAAAVNRCEDRNGRVTYTDEPCPSGARTVRRVDDSPPVQVRDATAAPAAREDTAKEPVEPAKDAAKDSQRDATKAAGKDSARAAAKDAAPKAAAEAGRIAAGGRIAASNSPEQQIQQLDEQYARQRRECTDLMRRIDYARGDLDAVSASQRASAELALRRLQEQFKAQCPRR
jgi:colicin import membrane protein